MLKDVDKTAHEKMEQTIAVLKRELGTIRTGDSDAALVDLMEALLDGSLPAELHLETLQAAEGREHPQLAALVDRYDATRDSDVPLDQYREALYGGDAQRGARIFYTRTSVSCLRCHKAGRQGGEVGIKVLKYHVIKPGARAPFRDRRPAP